MSAPPTRPSRSRRSTARPPTTEPRTSSASTPPRFFSRHRRRGRGRATAMWGSALPLALAQRAELLEGRAAQERIVARLVADGRRRGLAVVVAWVDPRLLG